MPDFTTTEYILVTGIVWLAGVLIWLLKKFLSSYDKNTTSNVRLHETLQGVDRKLDTAAERDLEIVRTLSAIHARGMAPKAVEK